MYDPDPYPDPNLSPDPNPNPNPDPNPDPDPNPNQPLIYGVCGGVAQLPPLLPHLSFATRQVQRTGSLADGACGGRTRSLTLTLTLTPTLTLTLTLTQVRVEDVRGRYTAPLHARLTPPHPPHASPLPPIHTAAAFGLPECIVEMSVAHGEVMLDPTAGRYHGACTPLRFRPPLAA